MDSSLIQSSKVPSVRLWLKKLLPYYQLKELIKLHLIKICDRFPQEFDEALFRQLDLLFAETSDDFKQQRSQKHLIRIICSLFLIQKNLRKFVTILGEKRHLKFRFIQTQLQFPFGSKAVLSFIGGICLFDSQETFEERHLLLLVQKFIPDLRIVKGAALLHRDPEDSIQLMYVEFEKTGGGSFTCKEIALLKKGLENELHVRIVRNIPALFMIRNEEEVMRYILMLSRELDFSHEIPEMIINLDQLTLCSLSFTIILVRVIKPKSKTIEEIFQTPPSGIRFTLDRNQTVGYLNNGSRKEASVFRLEVTLDKTLLRADFSINYYLAREKVKTFILDVAGPVRDFNGGLLLKQGELLSQFKEAFPKIAENDPLLIENFFYSLSPIEKQMTLPLTLLCTLFNLVLEATKEHSLVEDPFTLKVHKANKNVFAVLMSDDFSFFKMLEKTIGTLYQKENFITFSLNIKNSLITGFIQNKEHYSEQGIDFSNQLEEGIIRWLQVRQNAQVANLAIRNVPTSFDPRVGGDDHSRVILKMLFEGLMRTGKDGKPTCALAESFTVSSDKKVYIFHLRPTCWSDGTPVIAYDFEYAWKKILSPEFNTQFAAFFSSIKNARLVKEGSFSLDELGVKALDSHTLQVTLEHPTSYFLELTTLPLFSPIPHKLDQIHPNWAFQEGEAYICNGPFSLKRKNQNYGFEFVKNPYYWDAQSVSLDQIFIRKIKDSRAYEMFGKGTIDWIGRLLPYWDPAYAKRYSSKTSSYPSSKVTWCVFNTQKFPFHNQKIRKALSYCIDKEQLISFLNFEDAIPATSPLPMNHSKLAASWKSDRAYAKEMLRQGLADIGIKKTDFPLITLLCPSTVLDEQTAKLIQQQWEAILGISCKLSIVEWSELFLKGCQGFFDVSLITWTAWVNDPIYTLNAFKFGHDEINPSKWENPRFQSLLDKASQDMHRDLCLIEAEKILIDEMPVNPLFSSKNQCISQEYFHVPCDPLYGYPDFKWAYIDKTRRKR